MNLVRTGPPEAPRVILPNGTGSVSASWWSLVRALDGTYEFVLLDYPGVGESESRRFSSVEEVAGMAAPDCMRLRRRRFGIVGFSFGSLIAQHLALEARRDVRNRVLMGASAHIYPRGVETIGTWLEL